MPVTDRATLDLSSWVVPVDHATADAHQRGSSRTRRDGGQTSLRAIIATSAFLVLFAICLMVGGHAAIDPLLSAFAARDTKGVGDIVVTMPDGKFCRHMSFDNATSEVIEGRVGACPDNVARNSFRAPRGFSWGAAQADPDK